MAETFRTRVLTTKRAWILLILLMVASAAIELLIHGGRIEGRNDADVLEWIPLILRLSGIVLGLVLVWRWETTTPYARRFKVLMGFYVACLVIGGISLRIGLTDWLEGLGRPISTIIYATTTLGSLALLFAMCAMAVKDMEERTAREVCAKLRHHVDKTEAPLQASSSGGS
jgi:hypothetical protein